MSLTYPTLISLKMLSIHLLQTPKVHGGRILNESTSLNTQRAGGTRIVINLLGIIDQQELSKTGRFLRKQSNLPSNPSLISKSKKLSTKNEDLGNS